MSVVSGIRDRLGGIQYLISRLVSRFAPESLPVVLPALDGSLIVAACIAGGLCYHALIGCPLEVLPLCAVGSLAAIIYVLRMNSSGYYGLQESAKPKLEYREILVCWFTTGLLLALIAFLLKISATYSRGAFISFYLIAPAALLAARKVSKIALAQAVGRGAIGRGDTVLIGDRKEMATLQGRDLLDLCGALQVRRFELGHGDGPSNDAKIISTAANFVRLHDCRQVLIALPWSDCARIEFVRDQVKTLPVAVRLLPDKSVRALSDLPCSERNTAPTIELPCAPLTAGQRIVKRAADVFIASFVLIFFLPMMVLAAIAIKLDSAGPVIFRQVRKGFNGRHFVILKFRTMTVAENGPSVMQVTRGDSRVTGIGRLLRSTSIDELPQLWNVLRGDMSLIGPRPHALAHDNYFESLLGDYAFRHHVKPGMTGWAQCNGARGGTPTIEHIAQRVKLDLWYINNWSLRLDVRIFLKTIFEVIRKRNAY